MNYGDHYFVERVERVEPCCWTSSTQPKCMGSTPRTCRVVSRRYEPGGIWALLTNRRAQERAYLNTDRQRLSICVA